MNNDNSDIIEINTISEPKDIQILENKPINNKVKRKNNLGSCL